MKKKTLSLLILFFALCIFVLNVSDGRFYVLQSTHTEKCSGKGGGVGYFLTHEPITDTLFDRAVNNKAQK